MLGLTDITTYIQSHLWLFLTTIAFGLKEIVEIEVQLSLCMC